MLRSIINSIFTLFNQTQLSPNGTKLPECMHLEVQSSDLKSKLIIIGDVHGCFDELMNLLDKCGYNKDIHTLIFVGDLVNKGPKSREVIQFAMNHNALVVRGNHDDAALKQTKKKAHKRNKKYEWINDLSQ